SAATAPPRRGARRSCRARPAVPLPSPLTSLVELSDCLDGNRLVLRYERRRLRFAAVRRAHVIDDDALEFLGDSLALERDGLLSIDVHGRDGRFAGAGQRDAEVGELRFARP